VVEHEAPRRVWAARLAAPAAFFGAAIVLVVLVQQGLDGAATETVANPGPALTAPPTTGGTTNTTSGKKRFYRVRAGETLDSIAAKFETSVEELRRLNPDIDDPLALQVGERIRIA
jgi:LysM repeat protein